MVVESSAAPQRGCTTEQPALTLRVAHQLAAGRQLRVELSTSCSRVGLMGPSGAGKTTLLRVIAGLVQPEDAFIALGSRVLTDSAAGIALEPNARRIGYVPQSPLLFPLHTVEQNLCFGRPSSPRLDLSPTIERLGLSTLLERRPRHLSGGEKQRVALGRALLSEPELLLCDEPFSALDRRGRGALHELLIETCERLEIPLVLVSHDAQDTERVCDEIHHLSADGKLFHLHCVAEGGAGTLLSAGA